MTAIYVPACKGCYWLIKAVGQKELDGWQDFVRYCGHPSHTAQAHDACHDRRSLNVNEFPTSRNTHGPAQRFPRSP